MKKNLLPLLMLLAVIGCKKGGDSGPGPGSAVSDPSISIEPLSLFEGNAGTNNFSVLVKLSKTSTKEITVKYSTSNGTALSGDDYTAASGATLIFAAGETSKNISISIVAD